MNPLGSAADSAREWQRTRPLHASGYRYIYNLSIFLYIYISKGRDISVQSVADVTFFWINDHSGFFVAKLLLQKKSTVLLFCTSLLITVFFLSVFTSDVGTSLTNLPKQLLYIIFFFFSPLLLYTITF